MFNAFGLDSEYAGLKEALKETRTPVCVTGCMDSQSVQLVCLLMPADGWTLYITSDEKKASDALSDFKCFCDSVWLYPARDLLFHSSDIHGNFITSQRVEALKHVMEDASGVLVTTIDALMDKLPAKKSMADERLRLFEGMVISTEQLSSAFVHLGYEPAAEVTGRGEFALRGGIIDIFPMSAEEPCRIELYGDEIDTIRSFDTASQRSIERIAEITVYPVSDKSGLGNAPLTSLLSYFDGTVLTVLDNPIRLKARASMVEDEFSKSVERRLESGMELSEYAAADIFTADETISRLTSGRALMFSGLDDRLADFGAARSFSFRTQAVAANHAGFEQLASEIRKYTDKSYRISIVTPSRTRAMRLSEELRDAGFKAYRADDSLITGRPAASETSGIESQELKPGCIEVVRSNLKQGYIMPDIKYVLLTEAEMFGQRPISRKKKKKYEGEKLTSLNELKYGDYVVHENHGIGVYRGIEHITHDGVGKDYIKIEYGDGGNLYLPATKLDMIQKYADSASKKPRLNKLSGNEWQKTRQRVTHAVSDIARELIELYAKRFNAKGFKYSRDNEWQHEFEELFPYAETDDQLNAIAAVKSDMESGKVMDRLICGDVGYGKTEIALRAAFKAVQDSKQVIFLVPTTILAQQHYNTFRQRFSRFPVKVEMMSRFRTEAENRRTAAGLKDGSIDIVIGTHRLLSKDVGFKDPGLLIIDEEQRFGVAHKEKIKQLKVNLDVLCLTATPIPRTLHMSLAGIRDLSTLDEPPFDRVPIQTYVMEYNDEFVREAVSRELSRGGQVFYVYNHVNGIDVKASALRALLPDARIEYAHGQMNERELEDIMAEFVNGEIDVLVSTTIVETGLDIPNANTLIVDGAENMGLSQLYQLRGRVGRSSRTAYAFLMYRRDKVLSEEAEKRLKAIREFTEFGAGIKIAMRDLEIRGAGNVLGAEQHGQMQAVGYDLYCKLLSHAVRLLQGQIEESPDFETGIDCDIDAFIPDSYISDEYQKLDLYKRIAEISTEAEYTDIQDELIDRYGDIPPEVTALLDIVMLKTAAHAAYVTELTIKNGNITMEMYPNAKINVSAIPDIIAAENGRLRLIRGQKPRFVYSDDRAGYHGPRFMMKKASELVSALRL